MSKLVEEARASLNELEKFKDGFGKTRYCQYIQSCIPVQEDVAIVRKALDELEILQRKEVTSKSSIHKCEKCLNKAGGVRHTKKVGGVSCCADCGCRMDQDD